MTKYLLLPLVLCAAACSQGKYAQMAEATSTETIVISDAGQYAAQVQAQPTATPVHRGAYKTIYGVDVPQSSSYCGDGYSAMLDNLESLMAKQKPPAATSIQ